MPPIYYLNPPPNPFWEFVTGIEDHPFFAQHRRPVPPTPPPHPPRPGTEQEQTQASASAAAAEASEKAKGKQPEANVEDPPEVDPSTIRADGKAKEKGFPFRGRGRFGKAFEGNDKDKVDDNDGRRRRGWHGPGPWGPPPFAFGPGHPFFGPHGLPGHHGPEGHGPHGPHGPHGRRGGPHRACHGPHSRSPPRGGPFGRHGPGAGFDVSTFLNNLGERLGIDLTSAAEGFGLKTSRSNESDFEPRTDIFDTTSAYTIHLSLPGAKKSDVGVDWDGEHSVLRIAGVVHRPGVDEEMMSRLVVDGRKRETGVFEKSIRLGTSKEPASIDALGITAKMVDGVLIIHVPKVKKTFEKKEVRVDGSSPERPEDAYMNEKDLLFDAEQDEEMYDAEPAHTSEKLAEKETPIIDNKGKQQDAAEEVRDDRSETVGFEHHDETTDTLPRYAAVDQTHGAHQAHDDDLDDWEKPGSDDEGEYVKINVD